MEPKDDRFADYVLPGDVFFAQRLVFDPRASDNVPRLPRNRDYYDLFLLLSGRGDITVIGRDGKTRETDMRPGHIYLWRPQDHRFDPPVTDAPIDFIAVGVRAAEWQAFMSFVGIPPARQTVPEAPIATFDLIEDDVTPHFEAIVRAAEAGASVFALVRFLTEIVPRLYYPTASSEQNAVPWLFSGVEAMRDEENLRIGLPRFRELTRVSGRQLMRLTRRYFGTTPGAILAEARIRHAMRLLASTSESISTIAERCGYGTAAHFSYRFRTVTGMTPGVFRERSHSRTHGARAPRPSAVELAAIGISRPGNGDERD